MRADKPDLFKTVTKKRVDNENRTTNFVSLLPSCPWPFRPSAKNARLVKRCRPPRSAFFVSSSRRNRPATPPLKHPASSFVLDLSSEAILELRTQRSIGRIQRFSIFFLYDPTCRLGFRDRLNYRPTIVKYFFLNERHRVYNVCNICKI